MACFLRISTKVIHESGGFLREEEKEFRHCIWLAEKEERERIYQTSIRPFRKATYTHFPEIDPRLRNYRSRYGAISND
ncbi:DUF2856 family protein [Escherichia coli]|nr:DUF2856 family protein [Escherichia coli]